MLVKKGIVALHFASAAGRRAGLGRKGEEEEEGLSSS